VFRKIGAMKHFLFFVVTVTAVVFAFAKPSSKHNFLAGTSASDSTLAGKWVLQPVLASDTASGRLPSITFNLASKKFTGNTGCNSMGGHFFVKGDSLVFTEQMAITRKTCEGYNEKAFIDNLSKTNRYKIVDGVLQLMRDQTILSKWTRKEDTMRNKT
jgi:heat shock protein HslJ